MKIAICCSMKYRELVRETMRKFELMGMVPLFPNINNNFLEEEITDSNQKKRLAFDHYKAIDEADKVYLITPDGYIGTSLKLELGYSIAKNKPIYFSEPTKDIGLDYYSLEFIPIENLKRFLEL